MPTLNTELKRGSRRKTLKVLTSPPLESLVITENLVLHLDAGDAASYPGGSTWYDLTAGAHDATLVNNPIYSSDNGGYLTFDGLDEYGSISNHADFNFGTGDFTAEYWALCNNTAKTYQLIGGNHNGGVGGGWYLYGKRLGGTAAFGQVAQVNSAVASLTQGAWYHVVVSRISGSVVFYTNNVSQVGQAYTENLTSSRNLLVATVANYGVLTDGNYHWQGRIAQFRLYKGKGLTAAEVNQNFNATRSRYGL